MNKEEMLIKAKQAVNDQIERIESGNPYLLVQIMKIILLL